MENGRITEYVKKNPKVDRINLVSGFVPVVSLVETSNFAAVGRGGRPSLPPLA